MFFFVVVAWLRCCFVVCVDCARVVLVGFCCVSLFVMYCVVVSLCCWFCNCVVVVLLCRCVVDVLLRCAFVALLYC